MNELKSVTKENIKKYTEDYLASPVKQVMTNSLSKTSIEELAFNQVNSKKMQFSFSIDIPTMRAVSQMHSGRCWIFAGLNFLREKAAHKKNLDNFEFSQSYIAFWDKVEKTNFFLEQVISTAQLSYDDRNVLELFNYAIVDGGFWSNLTGLIKKYGLVPKDAMPETFQSSNTETLNNQLNYYLRKVGANIRNAFSEGKSSDELYEMIGDVLDEYINVISLPYDDLPFGKSCMINQAYRVIGGTKVKFLNLGFEKLKELTIKQLTNGEPVVCACDSDKMCNEELQIWDDNSFEYAAITGSDFSMTRKDYLQMKAGTIDHYMMITGVNITEEGITDRWKIENSYGIEGPNRGYFICSDTWYDKYIFNAVINRKYLQEYVEEYEGIPLSFNISEII